MHHVDWAERHKRVLCAMFSVQHVPPTPAQEPSACVDGPEWPEELAREVVRGRRTHA